ncbi:unnamed protein product [Cladocopium goreaui]|uniref:Transmembrane protein n=1 Tax=Cladocopium goreaui TaxID=2562237 RepID=A0A9P1DAK9_9DINO|nr:unnamed protein product [Cladocopium goreaui]
MDFQAARALHRRIPAQKWCITKAELEEFAQLVAEEQIPSSRPNPFHCDPKHGPNLYDVNTYLVKPLTRKAGGQSYALMKHPEGLECEVFVSHSWHGGIFHLQKGVRLAWPQLYRLQNLYCCLLSNPQNLDLDEFIGGNLSESAFALALQKASYLLVVPNPSMGVYSRLWCVFEAYLGAKWNKIYLLPVVPDRQETCTYWFQTVGIHMSCGTCLGFPVWLALEHVAGRGTGLYSWLELIYRVLSLVALLIVLPYRHHPWSLGMMSYLTSIGAVFLLLDEIWSYDQISMRYDNWIAVYFHYGFFSNLLIVNALVTVLLVILKGEKAHFDQQKEMMHFHSLQDSHCSSAADEERIRQAIAGSEDEVETVISILLAAGAYTDNLRRAWDNGLDVERAGMTDVKSGVFFSILIWSVCALDLLSDCFIGHVTHRGPFVLLCILYALTVLVIPFSVWRLEKQGPDLAVFALKAWGFWGMFSLQLPIMLCYLQGYDEAETMPLSGFFNQSELEILDTATWANSPGFDVHRGRIVIVSRCLCMIVAWAIIWIGIDRWTRLRIWLTDVCSPDSECQYDQGVTDSECESLLGTDSEDSQSSSRDGC